MKTYTQKELEVLVSCPKRIVESPRKEMKQARGCLRNDMQLESIDGKIGFSVFMRKNERFPENFSIGLNVHPKNEPGSFCVLRYNGPHGDHVSDLLDPHPHFGHHIHKANAENIEEGLSSELYAELTDSYGSYEEALIHFFKTTNIENIDQYIDITQQFLPFPE